LLIQWAAHGQAAAVEDVSIDSRRLDILVAEQFLDGSDIVAIFE